MAKGLQPAVGGHRVHRFAGTGSGRGGGGGWAVLLSCPVLGVKDGGGQEAVAPTLPRPPWVRLASFVGRMRAVTAQV